MHRRTSLVIIVLAFALILAGIWFVSKSSKGSPNGFMEVVGPAGNPYADPEFYITLDPAPVRSEKKIPSPSAQTASAPSAPKAIKKPHESETIENISSHLAKYKNKYSVQKVLSRIETVQDPAESAFRFVVLGDTRNNSKVWQTIVQNINKWNPEFVVHLGDFTQYGSSREMSDYLFPVLENYAHYPLFPMLGNHDCRRGTAQYEYVFGGKEARVYHFNYGDSVFVLLDNTGCEDAMPWDEQLTLADKWLSEKSSFRKFVFIHLPPQDVEKWAYHSMPPEMSALFVELMSKHRVDHVFCGHIHAYSTASYGGVDYSVVGGGGAPLHSQYGDLGSSYHYVVVDVKKEAVEMKLVRLIPRK